MSSSTDTQPDYQSEMRRAAGLSLALALGTAAAMALAAYLSRPDAKKIEIGPTMEAVDNWLKKTTLAMKNGAKAVIEEIDSAKN